MGRIPDKKILITGAARGQGRSHAVRLAEEGADIVALDVCGGSSSVEYPLPDEHDLEETAELVRKTGRTCVTRIADVRERTAMRDAVAGAAEEIGGLDAVVANAGILPIGPGRPFAAFADTVETNLAGVLYTVDAAEPHLSPDGSIVVIGSLAGIQPSTADVSPAGPGFAGYRFAKQSLVRYVNALAQVLSPGGRRVNGVHPTNVDTPMLLNDAVYGTFRPDLDAPGPADVDPILTGQHTLPVPWVEAVDVSHAVVYLVSDESRYVTGTHLRIDAGAAVKEGL